MCKTSSVGVNSFGLTMKYVYSHANLRSFGFNMKLSMWMQIHALLGVEFSVRIIS